MTISFLFLFHLQGALDKLNLSQQQWSLDSIKLFEAILKIEGEYRFSKRYILNGNHIFGELQVFNDTNPRNIDEILIGYEYGVKCEAFDRSMQTPNSFSVL